VNQAIEPNVPADQVRQDPYSLPDNFVWDTLDLEDPNIVISFRFNRIQILSFFAFCHWMWWLSDWSPLYLAEGTLSTVEWELRGGRWLPVSVWLSVGISQVVRQSIHEGHFLHTLRKGNVDASWRIGSVYRALKPPGWKLEWHCGVRVAKNKKLVGFISAIPANISVHGR